MEKDAAGRQGPTKQERVRSEAADSSPTISNRQAKKVKKADLRDALKAEGMQKGGEKSERPCKFGATCRDFLATGSCGYLHRK